MTDKPDYSMYVEYMESLGWTREELTLDELNMNLVILSSLMAENTGTVIDIKCPEGKKISIMGEQQIPRKEFLDSGMKNAYTFRMRLADRKNNEISPFTKIRVTKEKTSESVIQLARVFYADLNTTKVSGNQLVNKTDLEWYRFIQGIELNGGDYLKVFAISPDIGIDSSYTKFALDIDLWER